MIIDDRTKIPPTKVHFLPMLSNKIPQSIKKKNAIVIKIIGSIYTSAPTGKAFPKIKPSTKNAIRQPLIAFLRIISLNFKSDDNRSLVSIYLYFFAISSKITKRKIWIIIRAIILPYAKIDKNRSIKITVLSEIIEATKNKYAKILPLFRIVVS